MYSGGDALSESTSGNENYDLTYGLRMRHEMMDKLEDIAQYELKRTSELVRGWIVEKIREYESNRRFNKFLDMRDKKKG
jgi:hypothetical protein